MRDSFVALVYETLHGVLIPEARVPGVEDAFAPGSRCERLYSAMLDAYERLCERLQVDGDEDADVEIIIQSLMEIEEEMCYRMYVYGAKFGIHDTNRQ